jgi:hypothetical protein
MVYCSSCLEANSDNRRLDEWVNLHSKIANCKICGGNGGGEKDHQQNRMRTWITDVDGCKDALNAFVQWIISEVGSGKNRSVKTIAVAHFAGRYDMHLLAGELYRMGGLCPQISRTGNKLYELKLRKKRNVNPHISFRDTFNWMPLKLADLPKVNF